MFLRALLAFLVMPFMVAFVVPVLWIGLEHLSAPVQALGFLPLILGTVVLLICVGQFYVTGKGTLAPWSPPKHLVTGGIYGLSRNPMYVAVTLILAGWSLAYHNMGLGVYAAVVFVAFHLRVVFGEEPRLAQTFGETWNVYRQKVRRWI
jgi:protein-S-isoprenylcysteine O-methyltransferase Ste14